MRDYINRQDAIEEIARRDTTDGTVKVFGGKEVIDILNELPSAQPERKRGRWIDEDDGAYYPVECSECRKIPLFDVDGDYILSNFCPNCGARMDKGDEA